MVATVRNLTSSSATSEYFRQDGGYYLRKGEDAADLRAKRIEHRNASAWHGKGAAALGLHPGKPVGARAFERLLQGHVIGAKLRLGRRRDGGRQHRPGFDITFSAPKSVSLAALLPTEKNPRGDRAVKRAHDAAVRETLDWIEATLLETRGWDPATRRRPRLKAPWMVAALFRHIASRNLDPQLHTHAVIANVTRDGEGRWKSVEPTLLHRNARLIGAYYRDRLARQLIAKGYSILPAMVGRLPSFELAGCGRALAGNRPVIGLAPSAGAADVLARETGIHVRTLQWFLARCRAAGAKGEAPEALKESFDDAVLVLDEASMVSTDQMRALLRAADRFDVARVVLVGDRSQLRAVEAGQPFRLLQRAGMTTAIMHDIQRQRDPKLRAAVRAVLAGDPGEAVALLGSSYTPSCPCVDAPFDASIFFGGSGHAVRCFRVSGLSLRLRCAAGLYGDARIGSKSDFRARTHAAHDWFSRSRLVDHVPLPDPPSCPHRLVCGRPL